MRAVNLIPSEQRGGGTVGARSGGAVFLVLGLLAGLVVLALLYGSSHSQLKSRRTEAATLSAQAQQVEAQAAQLAPYASFMQIREQRLTSIAQLVGGRFDWSNAMGEISRVLPSDVSLSTLVGAVGAAAGSAKTTSPASTAGAVSSATPPGTTPSLTLTGCATSQTVVAQMLVRLRLIAGVSDVALQSSTKAGGGASGGNGTCAGKDPVFSVVVNFEPLPTATTPSVQALTSANGGSKHTAAAVATGGSR